MIKLGNIEGKKGTVQKGFWHTGSYADGTRIALPVMIATGEQEGPVLWIEGCIHGDEYGGAGSIIKIVESLNLKTLKGTLIAVPVTNLPSYLGRSRISPLDGPNLNRIFPGNTTGTYSYRLADALIEAITETSDYLLDLHSGGIALETTFYSIYMDDNSESSKISKKLAKSLGADVVWRVEGGLSPKGTITDEAASRGIPSVTLEVGGGTVTDKHIENYTLGITNMMKVIGMLDGDITKHDKYTIVNNAVFFFNQEGGLFVPDVKVGTFLKKNERIGHIINFHGETVDEVLNPWENGWIAAIRHNYVPTDSGELVAESYEFEKEESYED